MKHDSNIGGSHGPADANSHWLNDGWTRLALRLGTVGLLLAIWQLAGDDTVALLFPTFTRTLEALAGIVADGSLPMALLITNQTLVAGFALAAVLGVAIGVVSASAPIVDRTVSPYFTLLVAVPIIALVPVVQALMGLSFQARMTVVTLFAIPYIVINTTVAVRRVDPALLEMARSYGAGRWALMREVVLPAAVPGIMTGIRIGLGQALIGMVVAELTIVGAGVGSLILEMQGRFRVAPVLAVAITVVLQGVLLISLVEWLERRMSQWSRQ
jgi:ABC-type nitrate/sulfonate/bicarbonate transport system permease component